MDELLLFTVTSPSMHFKQTGSLLQFLLTSSPLNTDGRALTIHSDDPFIEYQLDGLLLTISIDELSPQLRWTSSYYLRLTSPSLHFKQTGSLLQFLLTSSPLTTDGRALTIHSGEPFTALQTDRLPYIIRIDEPFTPYQSDGLLLTISIDELSP